MHACGRLNLEMVVLIFVAAQIEGDLFGGALLIFPVTSCLFPRFLKKKLSHAKANFFSRKICSGFPAAYKSELKKSRFGWLKKWVRSRNSKDKCVTFKMPSGHLPETRRRGQGGGRGGQTGFSSRDALAAPLQAASPWDLARSQHKKRLGR